MVEVVAVVGFDQVALLHITQQPLVGFFQRIGRYGVALITGAQQEVGDISRQPILFLPVCAPQAKAAVVALHAQQALDPQFNFAGALGVRLTFQAQAFEQRRVSVQRRVQAAGGLLGATIRVRLERTNLFAQVQRRAARQAQQGFAPGRFKGLQLTFWQAPRLVREHRPIMLEQRRVRRAHAQRPFAAERRQGFTRQVQTTHGDLDHARTKTAQRLDRDLQRTALARAQRDVLRGLTQQVELAVSVEGDVQFLRFVGQVGQVQRQAGLVPSGQKARCGQLGHQGCSDHGFGLGHAVAIIGPGLRHQAQFAVEVRDIDADFAFALGVQRHRCTLQRDDVHAGGRAFTAFGQGRVTAECEAGQTALPGFDQLPVNIQLVGAISLAPKQAGVRIRGRVIGNVQHPDVHRSQQDMGLLRNAAVSIFSLNFHRQRLFGAHFFRRIEGQCQLALGSVKRQVQHAHGAFWGDIGFTLTGADHQRTNIQIVARPRRVEFDVEGFAFGRDFNFFPPQRPVTAFDQQITFARSGRRDRDFGGIAIAVRGFVQRQLDLIRAHGASFGVVLGTVTGPEAHAADQPGLRVFDLDTVRAPLHREADLGGFSGLYADRFFVEVQKLLVVVIAPAVAV